MEMVLVTGGAGFLGSRLVKRLVEWGDHVIVIDNMSTGSERNLSDSLCFENCSLIKIDILNRSLVRHIIDVNKITSVYHFAANADVRNGINDLDIDLEQNVQGTCSLLWACRETTVKKFIFASSAAVYGEPTEIPTKEEIPLIQTSVYGASKAAAEMYIQAYSEYFNVQSFSFRFTSCLGEGYSHGVVFDFVSKLKKDPTHLEILGDGKQLKSYLYVEDALNAIFSVIESPEWLIKAGHIGKKNIFNLGHEETVSVKAVADIVCDELGLTGVKYSFTGGCRGWVGDSPTVLLDLFKLKNLGWRPRTSIEEGIRKTVRYLKGVGFDPNTPA
jgi:UDP-glucose 4-epimerase